MPRKTQVPRDVDHRLVAQLQRVVKSASGQEISTGMTLAECIPDRTISVETIVIARERLREALARARDVAAAVGEAFDQRQAVVA